MVRQLSDFEIRFLENLLMQYHNSCCEYLDSYISKIRLKKIVDEFLGFYQREDNKNYTNHTFIIQRIYIERVEINNDELKNLSVSKKTLSRYRVKYMTLFKDLLSGKYISKLSIYR